MARSQLSAIGGEKIISRLLNRVSSGLLIIVISSSPLAFLQEKTFMDSGCEEKKYRRVADISEVPLGAGLKVCVENDEIALFNLNGKIYAINDLCPHRGAPLSEGFLDAGKVFCPEHCFDFNLQTGECQIVSHLRVATYPVKLENGGIFILY